MIQVPAEYWYDDDEHEDGLDDDGFDGCLMDRVERQCS
jgi:hypothetical protein